MRRIAQSDLQRLYRPVPQELYDDVDFILSAPPDGKEHEIVKKKLSISLVLAAVLLLMGATALAVKNLDLFRQMRQSSSPILPLDGAEDLVETGLGCVENEWVRVNVEEAAYDGRGVMALMRISPKDAERYAMMNPFLQDASQDVYDIYLGPDEVPEGVTEVVTESEQISILNGKGRQELFVNGESVAIPEGREAAQAIGTYVYREDGKLYYTFQERFDVLGRKDGKQTIGYWLDLYADGEGLSSEMDAEECADGSVLIWFNGVPSSPLPDTVELTVRAEVVPGDQSQPLDLLTFTLQKNAEVRKFRIVPEDDHRGDGFQILGGEIAFSKVCGYLSVEYAYALQGEMDMGCSILPYTADGDAISTTGGSIGELGPDAQRGFTHFREEYQMQSFDKIPEVLILEAKAIDGEALGRCTCRLVETE